MRSRDLAAFIKAREYHRFVKEGALVPKAIRQKPDPIISQYRFCNVNRENDRVTKFVRKWSQTWADQPEQWFAFVVARLFNNEDTLGAVGDSIIPFRPTRMRRELNFRADEGLKNFNAAYIVSTNGRSIDKVEYVIDYILTPMWHDRKTISSEVAAVEYLHDIWRLLMGYIGMGSFISAQIVADLKYERPWFDPELDLPTAKAKDWYTFVAPGPGSRRGLNRVMNLPPNAPRSPAKFQEDIATLHKEITPHLPQYIGSYLHRQDLQNCLCEFDKYERVRLGEGVPKQFYRPKQEK